MVTWFQYETIGGYRQWTLGSLSSRPANEQQGPVFTDWFEGVRRKV